MWARGLMAAVLALFFLAQNFFSRSYHTPFPTVEELVSREEILKDMGSVFLGMRRLGADLVYIQMLQYYGSHEGDNDHVHDDQESHEHDYGGGEYPKLAWYVRRIFRLDPYFRSAVLYGAGALALNLGRSDEALDLLKEAIERDPLFWRYSLYLGAIGYAQSDQPGRMIPLLEQARKYPDCPVLVKNILGNIYKKQGRWDEAEMVFTEILETSRDEGYKVLAQEQIRRIEEIKTRGRRDFSSPSR